MTTVLEALNAALHRLFADDGRVLLLGEDVLDPYGGAFKVTRGLSNQFPGRVLTTPISEAGIVGAAAGMALRGLRPIVEIMFGDFLTLAADQLINHAAKFRWMYNDQASVPLIVRTPMGGRRGYGPTHSQTLEKHFLGAPGLGVVAPAALQVGGFGPGELLHRLARETRDPLIFVENKLLYLLPVLDETALPDFDAALLQTDPLAPVYRLALRAAPPPQLTLAAYGYMAELCRQAVLRLAYEEEIFCELLVPTRLAPPDHAAIVAAAGRSGRLLAIEEAGLTLGWGAELLAQAAEQSGMRLRAARRLAALDLPIPASGPLEAAVLPGVEQIVQAARSMV